MLPWQSPVINRPRFSVGGGGYNPGAPGTVQLPRPNQYGITAIPRSTNQGSAISTAFQTQTGNQAAANQTVADFTRNFLAQRPQMKAYTDEENNAIGRFYGTGPNSVVGDLAAIERRRGQAVNSAAQSAVARAMRQNKSMRRNTGNNSYNDQAYAQILGDIAANTASEQAANDASNYRWTVGQQPALAGARSRLITDLLNRDTAPADLGLRYQAGNLSNLNSLASLEDRNTIYDDSALRRAQLLNLF